MSATASEAPKMIDKLRVNHSMDTPTPDENEAFGPSNRDASSATASKRHFDMTDN